MPKQIGWSNESNLLYQISQQITRLINVTGTSGGGSITGSGTTNYVPKWTSSSALGNSLIFDDGTNVGIGTSTPSQKLDVIGSTRIVGNISVGSNGNAIPSFINGIYAVDGLSQFKQINVSNGCITFNEGTAGICGYSSAGVDYMYMTTNSTERMRILQNGNVGIGTATPSQKLDVNGNISANLLIAVNDFYGSNVRVNGFSANTITYMPFYSNASPYGEIMRMQNDGSVLIGTTVPNGNKLQVNGNIYTPNNISSFLNACTFTLSDNYMGYAGGDIKFIKSDYATVFAKFFESTGNFRIGTGTDSNRKLQVVGEAEFITTVGTGTHTTSGNHLPIWVNNVKYWIALLNPPV